MSRSLAQLLLEAHRESSRTAAPPWRVRPEHVVLDEREGTFALGAFAATGRPLGVRLALLVLDRRGVVVGEGASEDGAALRCAAQSHGLHVALPGLGSCGHVYAERFAAPGRLALGSAPDLAPAGALGMLVLGATRLESAAALTGATHAMLPLAIEAVQFHGAPGLGVSGHDIAVELSQKLAAGERVIEACGAGVERLAMRERFAIASAVASRGAGSVVFPSDDVTHEWLRAQGRDADWKRSPTDLEPDVVLEMELETVEPWLQRPAEADAIRAVRHAAGTPVRRVVVGPRATYGDWAALAAVLGGMHVDERVACVLVPGSRRMLETASAQGLWTQLMDAGVTLATVSAEAAAAQRRDGAVLEYGVSESLEETSFADTWRASLESCAAAALTGVITDPREVLPESPKALEPQSYVTEHDRIVTPVVGGTPAPLPRRRPVPRRGVVLLRVDDDAGTARVLPLGPRVEALPLPELVELAFGTVDRGFVVRARETGCGWLLAGRGFLCGERPDIAAWILARLEVRGVIARGYAEGAHTALVHAGVLPLLARGREHRGFEPGDELEMPGGFEALEPAIPVTLRNLTRGTQFLLAHRLNAHAASLLKAGGILSQAVAAA